MDRDGEQRLITVEPFSESMGFSATLHGSSIGPQEDSPPRAAPGSEAPRSSAPSRLPRSSAAVPRRAVVAAGGLLAMVMAAAALIPGSLRQYSRLHPPVDHLSISGKSEDPDCQGCGQLMIADKNGVVAHPEQFSDALTFEDVQNVKRALLSRCPQRCRRKAWREAREKRADDGSSEDDDDDDDDTAEALVEDVDHPPADCHTSRVNESCYEEVLYIQTQGLRDHPKWFKGLNSASSFEQIQAFLHKRGKKSKGHCPAPCAETCHDALPGEPCYGSVDWALKEGLRKRPDWYLGLTPESNFKEVQHYIHNDQDAEVYCPSPCDFCHTAKDGERCFSAVDWVLKEGLDKQPAAYRGLSSFSSFEEVQDHLHRNKSEAGAKCPKPCPPPLPDFS